MGQNQLETYLDIWLDNIGYTVLFGWFVSITWITIDHKMSLSERIRSYKDWTVSLSTCLFIHVGMRMSQSENGGTHWEAYSSDILAGTQAFQKIKIIQKSDNFTTSFSRVHSSTFFNSWHTEKWNHFSLQFSTYLCHRCLFRGPWILPSTSPRPMTLESEMIWWNRKDGCSVLVPSNLHFDKFDVAWVWFDVEGRLQDRRCWRIWMIWIEDGGFNFWKSGGR